MILMEGVKEYGENYGVWLTKNNYHKRWEVIAFNQAQNDSVGIDLIHLLEWVAKNKPKLYMQNVTLSMMRKYT